MKVGIVLDDRLDVSDGVQQYVKTVGRWLERQGHIVRYIVAADSGANETVLALSKTYTIRFNKNRVRLVKPVKAARLRPILEQEQFDVLHVQMPYAPWFAGRVITCAPMATAVVGTFHVVLDSSLLESASPLIRPAYRPSLDRVQEICAVSPAAAHYLKQSLGRTSCVIPNAVDTKQFRIAKEQRKKRNKNIVFLGRLVERKGAEHLIRAFALMSNDSCELTIVGDGPLRQKLADLVEKMNLRARVSFAGFVDEAQKAELLAQADIAVFPATGGESFGIVLIEAMAAGAGVVLGGNNSGYRSVLRGVPECLFDPIDHSALARKLDTFLEDAEYLRRVHAKQKQLVKKFDIETVGPALLDLYRQAILSLKKMP